MTRRGLLAPLLAGVAAAACAPLMSVHSISALGPPGWRRARAAYGADPRQSLRLYRPARAVDLPILVFLPGDTVNAQDERMAREIAERGFVVVLAERRMALNSPYPAFISDAANAVAWARGRAGDLGGDASRIGVLGVGDGGRAALMLAQDRRYLSAAGAPGSVRAAAAFGAPTHADATFTDPSAYVKDNGAASVWRGPATDHVAALAFLMRELG